MNPFSKILTRAMLRRTLSQSCDGAIPRSGSSGEAVNCFVTKLHDGSDIPLIVTGFQKTKIECVKWDGNDATTDVEVLLDDVAMSRFEVVHYYGLNNVRLVGVVKFFLARITGIPYLAVHTSRLSFRIEQGLFNKRKLRTQKRDRVLAELVERSLNGQESVSPIDLIATLYSYKLFEHPDRDAALTTLESQLEALCDTGELRHHKHGYQATGHAFRRLEQSEEEERRHRESVIIQRWIMWLTVAVVFFAGVQANVITLDKPFQILALAQGGFFGQVPMTDVAMCSSLEALANSMYEPPTVSLLYHYTGYPALLSLARTHELWATDIHYLNDSSELSHAVNLFRLAADDLSRDPRFPKALTDQLAAWLVDWVANGHMLFVVCFSEDGDLLSQWRGYMPHGNGLCLGFDPGYLSKCATSQSFGIGKCLYEHEQKRAIAMQAIEHVLEFAMKVGPATAREAHPTQSFHPRFRTCEVELLRIAALFKHPAFAAEREWRAVSPVMPSYVDHPPQYSVGSTTLVPYKTFDLRRNDDSRMKLQQVILGPTPQSNLAMGALSKFLASNGLNPPLGTCTSTVPYRAI